MNFKCGKCGIVYNFEDFIKLRKEQAVNDDPDYGEVSVCKCGYRFHKDAMNLITKLQKSDVVVVISTIFLEMRHYDDDAYYYETAIFPSTLDGKDLHSKILGRYVSKEDAERGHQKAIKRINFGSYKIDKEENRLILESD